MTVESYVRRTLLVRARLKGCPALRNRDLDGGRDGPWGIRLPFRAGILHSRTRLICDFGLLVCQRCSGVRCYPSGHALVDPEQGSRPLLLRGELFERLSGGRRFLNKCSVLLRNFVQLSDRLIYLFNTAALLVGRPPFL